VSDRPPFRLRVRGVDPGEVTTAFGAVRTGSVAIGHLVDVVFGRQRSTVPVLGLVTAQGGAQEVGVGDGVVHVVLPALDRTQVGPGATLATPGTVRAAAAAELVVQVLGELPLRVEVSAWELGRRLAGREGAAAVAGVVDAALAAERARPDPDPDRFWDRVLRELAERAPALEDEARAARFDVNALASAVYLRPLGGRSVYLDFDGTVVHGRASDRLRAPDHPGAVLRAAVTLTPADRARRRAAPGARGVGGGLGGLPGGVRPRPGPAGARPGGARGGVPAGAARGPRGVPGGVWAVAGVRGGVRARLVPVVRRG
jgi:hypothetical protein